MHHIDTINALLYEDFIEVRLKQTQVVSLMGRWKPRNLKKVLNVTKEDRSMACKAGDFLP